MYGEEIGEATMWDGARAVRVPIVIDWHDRIVFGRTGRTDPYLYDHVSMCFYRLTPRSVAFAEHIKETHTGDVSYTKCKPIKWG